jgi:branched-chain amino acid transport system permease protein
MLSQLRKLGTQTPAVAIAGFVIVALLPLIGLNDYWQREIILIGIYTLLCSGLNLSFGYAGELALGQVAVFAAGAYISGILYNDGYTDILLGVLVAVVIAAAAGLISGIPGLRLSRWSLALVSFFFVLLIPSLVQIFSGSTGGANGLIGILAPTFFGVQLSSTTFYLVAIALTLIWMLIMRNLIVSRFGQSLRVLATSPTLAQSLGGSVYRLRVQAYVIGALPAGLAGVLYTYLTGYISPDAFTFDVLVAVLAAAVVGGANSVWGAPVGAAILVLGPLQIASFQQYSTAVYGAFLVLMGALFAGGLAGLVRGLLRRLSRWRGTALEGAGELAGPADGPALSIPGERLVISGIRKRFGELSALQGVDLVVEPGTVTAIIGSNGAGKTTLLNLISGLLRADQGHIDLEGRRLTGLPANRVSRMGVGRTFQTPIIPDTMTVLELVESGRLRHGNIGFWSAILRLPRYYQVRHRDRLAALAALSFAGLSHLAGEDAAALPLGTRRLLEVVRSVAGEPNILLLDEPAAGLDDTGLEELSTLIRRTRDAGGTVVLVEHNVPFVMQIADQVYVMDLGQVIASGPPSVVRRDQRVIDSYLGRRHAGPPAGEEAVGQEPADQKPAGQDRNPDSVTN